MSAETPQRTVGSCVLCGSPLGRPAFPYEVDWDGSRYVYRRCSGCPTVLADPIPTEADRESMFAYVNYHAPQLDYDEAPRDVRSIELLRSELPQTRTILDFGCGTGSFLRAAAAEGYDCEGIEYEREAINRASELAGVPVSSLAEALDAGKKFDVVRVGHVLIVLADPAETLRSLTQLVAPGGHLLIETAVEMNASVSRWLLPPVKAVRRRLGIAPVAQRPPTQLWRTSGAGLTDFLKRELGCRVTYQRLFDDGFPLLTRGRSPQGARERIKKTLGSLAVTVSERGGSVGGRLGNQMILLASVEAGG